MNFILADNQDLTRIGLDALCRRLPDAITRVATNKIELLRQLQALSNAVVLLDYSLFDFQSVEDLVVVHQRYPIVHWILVSEELSNDFLTRIVAESTAFSIVMKHSEVNEFDEAIRLSLRRERYLCRSTTEQLLSIRTSDTRPDTQLTRTEVEILREIALGKTTKEIAYERCSSFHTVNTHRKNIFRKLDVNTAHEATKYALRAGLVDAADYYI